MSKKTLDTATVTLINETVSTAIYELKRQGLLKDNTKTPFQKTEQLLYNYDSFKKVIEEKQQEIEQIKEHGLPQKSKSITAFVGGDGLRDIKSEMEAVSDRIAEIEKSIHVTQRFIDVVDNALNLIRDNAYYDIIPLKYFQGKTYEEIADHFDKDISTISRNRNKLINELKIKLFSDEVIHEIFA